MGDTMEESITAIFTTSTLIFSIVIALATIAVRNVIEAFYGKLKTILPEKVEDVLTDFWEQWVLRSLPMILGGLGAYMFPSFPFPEAFNDSPSGRVFFGIVAGLFSSPIYSIVKFHTRKHLPKSIKEKAKSIIPKALSRAPEAPKPPEAG